MHLETWKYELKIYEKFGKKDSNAIGGAETGGENADVLRAHVFDHVAKNT